MELNNSQTNRSFQDKWEKNTDLAFELTQNPESNFQKWILERNGFRTLDVAKDQFKKYNRILDAGCGNGRATALLATVAPHADVVGIDQIDVSIPVENCKNFPNTKFYQKNLREDLDGIGSFDYIYCQEKKFFCNLELRRFVWNNNTRNEKCLS